MKPQPPVGMEPLRDKFFLCPGSIIVMKMSAVSTTCLLKEGVDKTDYRNKPKPDTLLPMTCYGVG